MSLVLAAMLLCAAPVPRAEDPAPTPPKVEHVLVPGTRVRLAPPGGHQPGRGFLGYQWPELGASLIVIEMPGAFAEVSAGFTEKGLAKGGMKLLESHDVKVDGRDARLVLVSQPSQGLIFRKWIAVFGEGGRSVILNGMFPEELDAELSATMKAALLGARWDPTLEVDPFAPLPWTLVRPEGLKFAGNMGTALSFTEDGAMVQKDQPGSARFTASPSMGEVDVGDPRTFAEKRARSLPRGKELAFESSAALDHAAGKGWEIVARLRDEKAELDLLVHQVLLVREGEYFLFVGQCTQAERDRWLPRFRASIASWKARPAPDEEQ